MKRAKSLRRPPAPPEPQDTDAPPEQLQRFVRDEWPGFATGFEAHAAWAAEVKRWAADHGGWVGEVPPFEVLGRLLRDSRPAPDVRADGAVARYVAPEADAGERGRPRYWRTVVDEHGEVSRVETGPGCFVVWEHPTGGPAPAVVGTDEETGDPNGAAWQ